MKKLSFLVVITLLAALTRVFAGDTINLSGIWAFKADPLDKGIIEKWFLKNLDGIINLPGSMASNDKGDDIGLKTPWIGDIVDSSWFYNPAMAKYRISDNFKIPFWLQPLKYYAGAAWYQKDVNIDKSWKGRFIELFLERCHWETHVWIDEFEVGKQNTLGAPHVYDLSSFMKPGKHRISIRVDNRVKDIRVGVNSHSISDHTQTNWNGMIGKLELRVHSQVHISNIQLYPNIYKKKVKVRAIIVNKTGAITKGKLQLFVKPMQQGISNKLQLISSNFSTDKEYTEIEIEYPMGDKPMLWDEFHPNLYSMEVSVMGDKVLDNKHITFGMRDFKTKGTQFEINGKLTFLRGTLECAIFPQTGYPPTDTASWMKIFRIAHAHGLNHIRFHSWCPPEAAFEAADHAGFYLQVECSSWANQGATIGDGLPLDKFLYEESEHIVNAYGNHPSFCLMLYGNEPAGKNQNKWLSDFVTYWKNKDSRRLYSSGAGWPLLPATDFNSTSDPRIQAWGQGLKSIINAQPPRCDYDWSDKNLSFDKPTISHEIGQWCVYPDFKEISQYTGVVRAKNFEIFKESLDNNHMGQLADSFLFASGKLQVLCYKSDIEAALRTSGFGGFQLLDLHDFPGQGTALVGVLSAFWGEKGYISPKEYSRFCNSVVPLVRLPKMAYNSGESLHAKVEIANFGEKEINQATPFWKVVDATNKVIFEGKLPLTNIIIGNGIKLGDIDQSLSGIHKAQKLTLFVSVDNYENSWDFWVYPSALPEVKGQEVYITQTLDEKAQDLLKNGGNVLLTTIKGSLKPEKGGSVAIGFSSIFWNTAWTNGQAPHTLGILCNPKHPALANFPTDSYSNWEWWDAMSHSNAIVLTEFSPELKPIIRVIDDWFKNRPLALIFEANVGKGKIIVSGVDLIKDADKRPEARQLLYSLKSYMGGNNFNPTVNVDIENLKDLFK